MTEKWRTVLLLALAELLAMGLWFSAPAVTPALAMAWDLTASDAAWLTMSVQIGFVVGAFLSALFNVADVWSLRYVFATGAVLGAATIGFFYGQSPVLVSLIALVWGFTVVADSAQFSTAVGELSDRTYMGTALTMQTSLGFLLTLVSIRLIPLLVDWLGWSWAFTILTVGSIFGLWAMWSLMQSPAAALLAGGRG